MSLSGSPQLHSCTGSAAESPAVVLQVELQAGRTANSMINTDNPDFMDISLSSMMLVESDILDVVP